MNVKRRLVGLIAACTILGGATVSGSALDMSNNVFTYGDTEIVIENTDIADDKMQYIADYIAGEVNDDGVSTCGILCIFGHDIETTQATQTTHNKYTTSPKCERSTYRVESCQRSSCDYIKKELIKTTRISACHG